MMDDQTAEAIAAAVDEAVHNAVAAERRRCASVCRAVLTLPGDPEDHGAQVRVVNACIAAIELGTLLTIEPGDRR